MIRFNKFDKFFSLLMKLKELNQTYVVYGSQKRIIVLNSTKIKLNYVALTTIGTIYYSETISPSNSQYIGQINNSLSSLDVIEATISTDNEDTSISIK